VVDAFEYLRPSDEGTAIALAEGDGGASIIAGGTDVLGLLKDGVVAPRRLVDINALPIAGVEVRSGGLSVGALTRLSDAADHPAVRRRFPAFAQAVLAAASPQLRNMATVGGSLLQRTRCGYFRDPAMPCNKRAPGTGCSAIDGEHRLHAILGGSHHCIAVHPSDPAVALLALDAVVRTRRSGGERAIPLDDLYLLPDHTPERETLLEPGELIVAVELPATSSAARSCYLKVRERASFEFALVSAAVALDGGGGVIRSARVALGGVAPRPWRAREAEAVLCGSRMTEATFAAAGAAAVTDARPRAQNAFKVELVRRVLTRALAVAGSAP